MSSTTIILNCIQDAIANSRQSSCNLLSKALSKMCAAFTFLFFVFFFFSELMATFIAVGEEAYQAVILLFSHPLSLSACMVRDKVRT